jgi:hypothetical protein
MIFSDPLHVLFLGIVRDFITALLLAFSCLVLRKWQNHQHRWIWFQHGGPRKIGWIQPRCQGQGRCVSVFFSYGHVCGFIVRYVASFVLTMCVNVCSSLLSLLCSIPSFALFASGALLFFAEAQDIKYMVGWLATVVIRHYRGVNHTLLATTVHGIATYLSWMPWASTFV